MNAVAWTQQAIGFVTCIGAGICSGVLFDFLLLLRYHLFGSKYFRIVFDMLFWTSCALLLFYSIFAVSGGVMRWYVFAGYGIGIGIYFAGLCKYVRKVLRFIIICVKKIVGFIFRLILKPLRLLYRVLRWMVGKGKRITRPMRRGLRSGARKAFIGMKKTKRMLGKR